MSSCADQACCHASPTRVQQVRRGLLLEYLTVGWNTVEGIVAVVAGLLAGSIALVGFGIDSAIEVSSGLALLWRLRLDADEERREHLEAITLRLVGLSFLALAAYVAWDATGALLGGEEPHESLVGIALAVVSLIVMPLLARAKRRVAAAISSHALRADARQTDICAWLSAVLLAGLLLNATLGWWWADPLAGLCMVPLIAWEGIQAVRGRACGCD